MRITRTSSHRQQHLAEIFGLRFFQRGELQFVEFGYAVDQLGHGLAEFFRDIRFRGGRVFHHVVQHGGDQGLRIEMPAREDLRNGEGMRDVRLARLAELAFVRGGCHFQRSVDFFQVGGLQIGGDQFAQCCGLVGRAVVMDRLSVHGRAVGRRQDSQ